MRAHELIGTAPNQTIINTIVINSLSDRPNLIDADLHGGSIGWSWNGSVVSAPPPTQAEIDAAAALAAAVPQAVTMRQARLALMGAGLLTTVNTAIANMAGTQGDAARIEWEFSNEVRRTQPLVLALAPGLGLTDAQLDDLFRAAALL